jgi:hypothetical protein
MSFGMRYHGVCSNQFLAPSVFDTCVFFQNQLYIQKTREVINGIRHVRGGAPKQTNAFVGDLAAAIGRHGANRKIDSE